MSDAMMAYFEGVLEQGTKTKLAEQLHELSKEDLLLLVKSARLQKDPGQAINPPSKAKSSSLDEVDRMGRMLARHHIRKEAAAKGHASDAILGEAIDLLSTGQIKSFEDSQAGMRKVAAVTSLAPATLGKIFWKSYKGGVKSPWGTVKDLSKKVLGKKVEGRGLVERFQKGFLANSYRMAKSQGRGKEWLAEHAGKALGPATWGVGGLAAAKGTHSLLKSDDKH